jgi:hypothetical protein
MKKIVLIFGLISACLLAQKVNLDTQTTGTNIYWDNQNKRFLINFNGSFASAFGKKFELLDPGPAWATYSGVHNSVRFNVNSYPASAQFGNNTVGITEALAGLISIPATSVAGNHAVGVAGYARGYSVSQGPVGVFGFGGAAAYGVSAWGFNTVTTNCGAPQCATRTGSTYNTLYGYELDINLYKQPDGSNPTGMLRGIYIIGGSEAAIGGGSRAIEVDSYGYYQSPRLKWETSYYTADGSASVFGLAGTFNTGNSTSSQPLRFKSRDGIGVEKNSDILSDLDGNFVLKSGSGLVSVKDTSDNNVFQMGPSNVVSFLDTVLNPSSTSNGVSSRSLQFRSRNAGGDLKTAYVFTDADGNLIIRAGLISLQTDLGIPILQLYNGGVSIKKSLTMEDTLRLFNPGGISAGSTITVGAGNFTSVTGSGSTVSAITGCSAGETGRPMILAFSGTNTIQDTGNLKLNGNFVSTPNGTLSLLCDGTNWLEVGRSAN